MEVDWHATVNTLKLNNYFVWLVYYGVKYAYKEYLF